MPLRRRRRRTYSAIISPKRPLDKQCLQIDGVASATNLATLNNTVLLYTATFPCTVTGIRYDETINIAAGNTRGVTMIVIVRDGLALPASLGVGTALTPLFTPEQNILVARTWGALKGAADQVAQTLIKGKTKTMRKLMGGDKLYLLHQGCTGAGDVGFNTIVQFFLKS